MSHCQLQKFKKNYKEGRSVSRLRQSVIRRSRSERTVVGSAVNMCDVIRHTYITDNDRLSRGHVVFCVRQHSHDSSNYNTSIIVRFVSQRQLSK